MNLRIDRHETPALQPGGFRRLLLAAALLSFGVVGWEHLFHVYTVGLADTLQGHLVHVLRDSLLAMPLALFALAAGLRLARRLGTTQGLLVRSAIVSLIFALSLVPSVGMHGALDRTLAPEAATTADGHGHTHQATGLEGATDAPGLALHGLQDALVGQAAALPLAALVLAVFYPVRRAASGAIARRRRRWLARISRIAPAGFILAALVVGGLGLRGYDELASVAAAPGKALLDPCFNGAPQRAYNVSAIQVKITYNRFGDHDPGGFMYVLDENIPAVRQQEASGQVSTGLRKDPIQPMVIRANLGECLIVNFTNRLSGGDASLHVHGLAYTADSAGSAVGLNQDTFVSASQTVTYRLPMPADLAAEGAYYFHSHGASRQLVAHGLFGVVVAEPGGSTYRDPETGAPLVGGNWEAIIVDPNGPDFRESTLLFHEVGDESFDLRDARGNNLPRVDDVSGVYRPGARAINYRSEPFRNRLLLEDDKSQGYGSYMFGDPATPMPRSYLGEPTKTRLVHAGGEVIHVYHLHGGGDRWRRNPKADETDIAGGLRKVPIQNAHSIRLDSQSIAPSETFSLEHECGAGGCQQVAADFLFHCHIGQHYVGGMWSFWRVFDTRQPDLATIPDRQPVVAGVTSQGLIGKTVEGKVVAPRAQVTEPNSQRALEDWVEAQLPPQGVRIDDQDATVWDWVKIGSPKGSLYLGEPEDTRVWPNFSSPTPGQRPEILFNPANGRYAWPLLRPHLGKRPPFSPNGHTGAPWLGEVGSAVRPDGLCPPTSRNFRKYPITAITLPIQVTKKEVDREGMIFVLSEDKGDVLGGGKPAQPLAIRSNVGDCVEIILTSELPDSAFNKFHSKVNIHTHFVQFDPQASDGVITGFSYEQSVRPYASEGRKLAATAPTGAAAVTVNQVTRLRPGIFIGIGLGEADVEARRIMSINGNTLTLDRPLASTHTAGKAVGVEFVRYAWFSDVDAGTVFWHDHVNFKSWAHGLFGAHIIEPTGSSYHDPATGSEVRSGAIVDIHAAVDASVGFGQKGSFREFVLWLNEDNPVAQATINLRAEPFDRRGGDQSLLFSSVTHGDPITPLPRAYVGDPFVIRALGVVEMFSGLRVVGHRWREERFAQEGVLFETVPLGISERRDPVLDGGAGGPAGKAGDYLYYSSVGRRFVQGAWGILRVHDTVQPELRPLPGRPLPPSGAGFPGQRFTGGRPLPANGPGQPCPAGSPVRAYDLSIFRVPIPFHKGGGGTDSNGVIYALASDEQAVLGGRDPVEPLVLRVNAGECLQIGLVNHLGERAGLSIGKLLFDPQGSYGAAVGFNRDSSVAPGARGLYRFYADQELGTVFLLDLADPRLGARGAFGAVIVEPEGSAYMDAHTGQPLQSGLYADIVAPQGSFREAVLLFQDEDQRIGQNVMPYPTKVEGFSGINYRAQPLEERLKASSDPSKVFDSRVHGDEATTVEAYPGDPIRYRVAMPWGEQFHVFSMEGHRWRLSPNLLGSSVISSMAIVPGMSIDAAMLGGAGGGIGVAGDYMYLDHRSPFLEAGLWGVMRVHSGRVPDLLALP